MCGQPECMLSVHVDEENPRLHVLCIDGEPWKKVHSRIFGRSPRLTTRHRSPEMLQSYVKECEWKGARRFTFNSLAKRSYHSKELAKKLSTLLLSQEQVEALIAECTRLGYLDDKEWVACFIRKLIARNLGPRAISLRLQARGLAPSLLDSFDSQQAQKERLTALLKRRFASHDLEDFSVRKKVVGALFRKGFELSLILEVLES